MGFLDLCLAFKLIPLALFPLSYHHGMSLSKQNIVLIYVMANKYHQWVVCRKVCLPMFIFEIAYNKLAQAHTKQISKITINSPYNNKYHLTWPLDVDVNMDLSDLDDKMQDHVRRRGSNRQWWLQPGNRNSLTHADSVINLCIQLLITSQLCIYVMSVEIVAKISSSIILNNAYFSIFF